MEKKSTKVTKKEMKKIPEGLEQTVSYMVGTAKKHIKLIEILRPEDVWETKGRIKRTIITHDGVKKIADKAGVSMKVEYQVLTQPTAMNNYQYTMSATIFRGKECVTELGEANRNNLGNKGRNNPANMAQKRAYDRAVFRLLGITGMLSEEELTEEDDNKNEMDGTLTPEENKKIAPIINQLLLAKNSKDLITFSDGMKEKSKGLEESALVYIRKLYQKRAAELKSVNF